MSEMMGVDVRLKVRPEWLTTVHRGSGDLEWDEVVPAEGAPGVLEALFEQLESVYYADDVLHLSGELNYGFPSSEGFDDLLREAGIPFAGSSDAKYEFDGDVTWWVPGMALAMIRPSGNEGVTLSGHQYRALVESLIVNREDDVYYIDRLIGLKDALDEHFVDPFALVDAAPLPDPLPTEED